MTKVLTIPNVDKDRSNRRNCTLLAGASISINLEAFWKVILHFSKDDGAYAL